MRGTSPARPAARTRSFAGPWSSSTRSVILPISFELAIFQRSFAPEETHRCAGSGAHAALIDFDGITGKQRDFAYAADDEVEEGKSAHIASHFRLQQHATRA